MTKEQRRQHQELWVNKRKKQIQSIQLSQCSQQVRQKVVYRQDQKEETINGKKIPSQAQQKQIKQKDVVIGLAVEGILNRQYSNNSCLFPGILIGRINEKFKVKLYCRGKKLIDQQEILQKFNCQKVLLDKSKQDMTDERVGYETKQPYQIYQFECVDKNVSFNNFLSILRGFTHLIKEFRIKIVVLGDVKVKGFEQIFFQNTTGIIQAVSLIPIISKVKALLCRIPKNLLLKTGGCFIQSKPGICCTPLSLDVYGCIVILCDDKRKVRGPYLIIPMANII